MSERPISATTSANGGRDPAWRRALLPGAVAVAVVGVLLLVYSLVALWRAPAPADAAAEARAAWGLALVWGGMGLYGLARGRDLALLGDCGLMVLGLLELRVLTMGNIPNAAIAWFGAPLFLLGGGLLALRVRALPDQLFGSRMTQSWVLVVALTAISGWLLAVPSLVGSFGPGISTRSNTALALVAAALALIAARRGYTLARVLLATLILVFAGLVLLEYFDRIDFGLARPLLRPLVAWPVMAPVRTSPSAAYALAWAALGLLVFPRTTRNDLRWALAWTSGIVVSLIGLLGLVGQMLDPTRARAWGGLESMAPLTATALLALGGGLVANAEAVIPRARSLRAWLPAVSGMLVVALSAVLWHNLVPIEDAVIRTGTSGALASARHLADAGLAARTQAVRRFAENLAVGEFDNATFMRLSQRVLRDFPGIEAVRWEPPGGGAPWRVARASEAEPAAALVEAAFAAAERAPTDAGVRYLPLIRLPDGRRRLLLFVGAPGQDGRYGYLGVDVAAEAMFDAIFVTNVADYAIEVREQDEIVLARGASGEAEASWRQVAALPGLPGRWELAVTPLPAVVGKATHLPALVLMAGIALGGLLILVLRMAGLARERAEQAEQFNAGLVREQLERREAESARDRARNEVGSILSSITDGFVVLDRQWHFVLANARAAEYLGQGEDDIVGRHLFALAPDLADNAPLRQAMEEHVGAVLEQRNEAGEWYEWRAYPHQDGLAVYIRDISAQRQAAELLRDSEARLSRAQELAQIGSWSVDFPGGEVRWSDEMYRILGCRPDSVTPSYAALVARLHPEDQELFLAADRAMRDGRAALDLEHRIVQPGGEVRQVHILGRLEAGAEGRPPKLVGTLQDITARKQVEHALALALARSQRQSAQFRALNRATLLATAKLGDGDLAQVLVEEFREAVGAHMATLHVVPEGGHRPLIPIVSMSDKYDRWRGFDAPVQGLGLLAEAARGGQILRLTQDALRNHPAWRDYSGYAEDHPPLRGLLAVPLRDRNGRITGFLLASDRYEGEFSADDESIAVHFAQVTALALGWARLIDDLRLARADLSERLAEIERQRALLTDAERLAHMGSWQMELVGPGAPYKLWSEETFRIFGLEPVAGQLSLDYAWPKPPTEDSMKSQAALRHSIDTGEPFDMTFRIRRPDGSTRWIHSMARIERGSDGVAQRVIGMLQDVTERRVLEEQEAAYNDLLQGIARGAPLTLTLHAIAALFERHHEEAYCSVLLVDDEQRLVTAAAPRLPAEYCAAIDGTPVGPAAGSCGTAAWRRERVIVTDIHTDPLWANYREIAERYGLRACWSQPVLARDGSVLGTFAVYYMAPREPLPKEIAAIDRTASLTAIAIEADHARRRVAESEQRFRSLFDYVPEAVFALDPQGRVVDCNVVAVTMSGYRREELIGRPLTDTAAPEERQRVEEHFARAAAGEAQSLDRQGLRPDGSRYEVISTELPIVVDGRQTGVFAIVRDVTEQRTGQEALERALTHLQARNRELQEFAFAASHDLQEPLRKIQAFGDRLGARLGSQLEPDARDYLERMRAAAGRMQQLIEGLLNYARIDVRQREFTEVDLNVVVRDVLSDLETRIEETGAQIDVGTMPHVPADRTQMRQLLQNLIGNALKFRHPERAPHVRVAAELTQRGRGRQTWVRIAVEDNGIGFDNRYRERIFAPFQRLHGRSEYEGSGIGLSIVRRIVEHNGGTISAEGRPGEGARFVIELPLRAADADDNAPPGRMQA